MRSRKNKNNKMILLIILLLISIGYALMSTTLKINGIANLKGNTWDVHWDSNSINVTSGSVSDANITLSDSDTKVNFSTNLKQPGDYYEFTVDAVNAGTIDAMIDDVKTTIKDGNDQSVALPDYIKLSITYDDGDDPVRFHKLAKREGENNPTRETYLVRIEFDRETDILPSSNLEFNISYELKYIQADRRAIDRNYVSLDGVTFNNVMLNLAYNANKSTIGSIDYIISRKNIEGYNSDVTRTIQYVTRASSEQYNSVKNTLSSDELINLSKNAEEKELYPIATNSAVGDTNIANMDMYMWYDKPTQTIYYYSPSEKIKLPKDVSEMFWGLTRVTTLDVSGFDTSKVKNIKGMFRWCPSLQSINFNGWNTSKVTNMSWLFFGDDDFTTLDLSNFDTSNVENMSFMFAWDYNLTSIQNINNWDVRKVKNFGDMFQSCGFTSLDLSKWHTDSAQYMDYMFYNCDDLITLDISNFNTSNVTNMYQMFFYDELLTTIYAGDGWTTANADGEYMFLRCSNLVGGNGTHYNENYDDKTYARIDEPGSPGYFTRKTN